MEDVMDTTYYTTVPSPIDDLMLTSDGRSLTGLFMSPFSPPVGGEPEEGPFEEVIGQLDEYFTGARKSFDVPLNPIGTRFQLSVWAGLREIPYGKTISYGELARWIGNPRAVRAVGRANGSNPIAVIVPCHRVIGADGTLTGYGGGLDRKAKLLAIEGVGIELGAPERSPA
jgi:methylated-DNA-[protein]-cysteine S-methyltransferase